MRGLLPAEGEHYNGFEETTDLTAASCRIDLPNGRSNPLLP